MERAKDIRRNVSAAECGYREDGYPAADCVKHYRSVENKQKEQR